MKRKLILTISAVAAVLLLGAAVFGVYVAPKKQSLESVPTGEHTFTQGGVSLYYDTEHGTYSFASGGAAVFTDAYAAYQLDTKKITSRAYTDTVITSEPVSDKTFGSGLQIKVVRTSNSLPNLEQTFTLYETQPFFLTKVSLIFADGGEMASNYIAPIVIDGGNLQNGNPRYTKFLEVPFDNDSFVKFQTKSIWQGGMSHEVGALFTPDNGAGIITGAVTHDTWKTGISMRSGFEGIHSLTVYGGDSTRLTHGYGEHGTVSGAPLESPAVFFGAYDNWKAGMEQFTQANTAVQPKRKAVTDQVPFGWNSWGAVRWDLDHETAIGVSDYIKENLQPAWQQGPVYVGLDSYWDNMTEEELRDFVAHCKKNGQEPGIYWAPFVSWYSKKEIDTACLPGTDIPVNDVRLKRWDEKYYGNQFDGCFPLDVTHPTLRQYIIDKLTYLKSLGFTYIKLDFLVQATFEGLRYNPEIQTGMQAYNYAMQYVTEAVGDDMFINLAMSPTFPYQYANGRRIACDAYSSIKETKYTLNAVTYGFWQKGIYDYPDPDHTVVWGRDGDATQGEARARVTLGAIAGTSFLTGDNFYAPAGDISQAKERFREALCNPDVIRVIKLGKPFLPQLPDNCPSSAEVYTLETDGKLYVAVFNFTKKEKAYAIKLPDGNYRTKELWSGKEQTAGGILQVTLPGADAMLFECVKE